MRDQRQPTADERQGIIKSIKKTWNRIGMDVFQACGRPDMNMTGEQVREVVADYVDHPLWWKLSHEVCTELLVEALPHYSYSA